MLHRLHPDDVVAALASAPGSAPRGIVRISGTGTDKILRGWFVPDSSDGPAPVVDLYARLGAWRTPGTVVLPDLWHPLRVDLYYWPGPRSYTGESLAELHTVGSPPILEAVLAELFRRGVRPAEPGEFTLRAFLSGRIDLPQAEAVLGVIDAANDSELRTALGQLAGGLSNSVAQLRNNLLDLLADLEAGLDFADEAIEFVAHAELVRRLREAAESLDPLWEQSEQRERSQTRWRVVLAGPPNAGKSTLFNALLGRAAAIVSAESGTTRDYLSAEVELCGVPVLLIDTAGEQAADHEIERRAQMQRSEQIDGADLVLWCAPWGEPRRESPESRRNAMCIRTKGDLATSKPRPETTLQPCDEICVSAFDAASLECLSKSIAERLAGSASNGRQLIGSTAARTRDSLRSAAQALVRAVEIAEREVDQELLAIEIRDALAELGKITGAVYTEDILDRIFSKFCIGK